MAWIEKHFGTVDRFLAIISLFFSTLSVLLTPLARFVGVPGLIIARDLIVLVALGAIIFLLSWKYLQREMKIERLTRTIELDHSREKKIQIITASFAEALLKDHARNMAYSPVVAKEALKNFREVMMRLTMGLQDGLKKNFEARELAVDEDIAIAIKVFQTPDQIRSIIEENKAGDEDADLSGDRKVVTIFRDPTTYTKRPKREILAKTYSVASNSAFDALLIQGQSEYMFNDLKSLGVNYQNKTETWQDYYNATVVVPIGRPSPGPSEWKVYGVLAADSLNSKKLDLFDDSCLPLMNHVADLLALYFLMFESGSVEEDAASK